MNFNGEQCRAVLIYAILCLLSLTGKVTFWATVLFLEFNCHFRPHSALNYGDFCDLPARVDAWQLQTSVTGPYNVFKRVIIQQR